MGVKDLLPLLGGKGRPNKIWNKGLSQETALDVNIVDLRNKVVAIDVAAFVFPLSQNKSSFTAQFLKPPMPNIYVSEELSKRVLQPLLETCLVKQIYLVYDGLSYPPKAATQQERRKKREAALQELEQLRKECSTSESKKSREALENCYKEAAHPDSVMIQTIKSFTSHQFGNKVIHLNALFEADPQIVALEQAGLVDFIIGSDSDLTALGGQNVLYRLDIKNYACLYVKYDEAVVRNPRFAWNDLGKAFNKNDFYMYCLLLGNDYVSRIKGFGPAAIYKYFSRTGSFSIDELQPGVDFPSGDGSIKFGGISRGKEVNHQQLREELQIAFLAGFGHPVFKISHSSEGNQQIKENPINERSSVVKVEPLYGYILCDSFDRSKWLNALKVTGQEFEFAVRNPHDWFYGARAKAFTSSELKYAGSVINFSECPVSTISDWILERWLFFRGVILPGASVDRTLLEATVNRAKAQKLNVVPQELLETSLSYNTPKPIFLKEGASWTGLAEIKDFAITRLTSLNAKEFDCIFPSFPSIRKRGTTLFFGGHLEWPNIKMTLDAEYSSCKETKVLLIQANVVASFRSLTYRVTVAFKRAKNQRADGSYRFDHLASGCACVAGGVICSHQLCVLGFIRMLQIYNQLDNTRPLETIMPDCVRELDATAIPVLLAFEIVESKRNKRKGRSTMQEFVTGINSSLKSQSQDELMGKEEISERDNKRYKVCISSEIESWLRASLSKPQEDLEGPQPKRRMRLNKSEIRDAVDKCSEFPVDKDYQMRVLLRYYSFIKRFDANKKEFNSNLRILAQHFWNTGHKNYKKNIFPIGRF